MRLKRLDHLESRKLFEMLRLVLKSSWAFGALGAIGLVALSTGEEALSKGEVLGLSAMVVSMALLLILVYWWASRKVLAELERRCPERAQPIPESSVDKSTEVDQRKYHGKFGLGLFLFSIPVFLSLALLGFPPFQPSGLPTLAGLLVIVVVVCPALVLMIRSAQCPACGNLVSQGPDGGARCTHCGAKLRK